MNPVSWLRSGFLLEENIMEGKLLFLNMHILDLYYLPGIPFNLKLYKSVLCTIERIIRQDPPM